MWDIMSTLTGGATTNTNKATEKIPDNDSPLEAHDSRDVLRIPDLPLSPIPKLPLPPESEMSPTKAKSEFEISPASPQFQNTLSPKSGITEPFDLTVDVDRNALSPTTSNSPASPTKATKRGSIVVLPVESPGLEIKEGSDAANALKANAEVKVTKVGKVARAIGVQAVRKTAKKIIHAGSGKKRGKPPRVPEIEEALEEHGHLDILIELSENEDEILDGDFRGSLSPSDYPSIIKSQSSDSSDADVPTKVVQQLSGRRRSHQKSVTLLDSKGKRRVFRLDRRMKKKLKKKEKKRLKRNYVKGKVIDGKHELYTLSIAMMLGLRHTMFLTNKQIAEDRKNGRMWLDSDEFMKVEKYIFRPDGKNDTLPHSLSHTFKFKDYSPIPFLFIRRMFGINEYEFHNSVCGNASFIEFISNAKSGQFFFYSSDGKYMIKTMTNAESKFLRRILPHYFQHCSQNPNTLLTKFLGMYRVKLYHLRKNVKFVIMNSVFDTDKKISSFYDLKGSVVGRNAKFGESVLKDNDLRKNMAENGFCMPEDVRERMREQVRRDCDFLKEMKIMDYSMLVGIHYIPTKNTKNADISGLTFRGIKGRKPKPLERSRSEGAPSASAVSPLYSPSAYFKKKVSSERKPHVRSRTLPNSSLPILNLKEPMEVQKKTASRVDIQNEAGLNNQDEHGHPFSRNNFSIPSHPPFKPIVPANVPFIPNINSGEGKNCDQSVTSASTFGYDEEDENSLLHGPRRPSHLTELLTSPGSIDSADEEYIKKERAKIDRRREIAIEQNYWPYQRHYELNGDRRIIPLKREGGEIEDRFSEEENEIADALCATSCFGDPGAYDPDLQKLRENLSLDEFVPPISSRRDGGLMMDLTGKNLPLKVKIANETLKCDGKIYYMGIIDILQQFNVRKRFEARLRKIQGGEKVASCVHPEIYAERFVSFFDEYTRAKMKDKTDEAGADGVEEVLFEGSKRSIID